MADSKYLNGLKGKEKFSRKEMLESFRREGYSLSDASFYKTLEGLVHNGNIIRESRDVYFVRTVGLRITLIPIPNLQRRLQI